jgi:hypothetical protein
MVNANHAVEGSGDGDQGDSRLSGPGVVHGNGPHRQASTSLITGLQAS